MCPRCGSATTITTGTRQLQWEQCPQCAFIEPLRLPSRGERTRLHLSGKAALRALRAGGTSIQSLRFGGLSAQSQARAALHLRAQAAARSHQDQEVQGGNNGS